MKRIVPALILTASVAALVALSSRPLMGQGGGGPEGSGSADSLFVFADMALFSGGGQPRNCFTMNRFQAGEPAGFRISVMDGATGEPATDAAVVVHLTYGGQTVEVPARWRGTGNNARPNLWTAKWEIPADAPTGVVDLRIVATDAATGRSAEWRPFPNNASHLTIVNE